MQSNDRIFDIKNGITTRCRYNITEVERAFIKANKNNQNYFFINYTIRNIGAGSAVDMTVCVNGFKEPLAMAKEECVQLLFMVVLETAKLFDLEIRLDFTDVENRGRYLKKEIIHIVPGEIDNDELVIKLERGEQKLINALLE